MINILYELRKVLSSLTIIDFLRNLGHVNRDGKGGRREKIGSPTQRKLFSTQPTRDQLQDTPKIVSK